MIIPTYNRSDLLGRAVSSVLAQNYQPFELLVIDDGSTQDIISCVQAVAGDRARVIRRDIRGGAAAARNTGCEAAKHDNLAFLDSDDEWLPGKLETQIAWLKENSELQLCCSAYEIVRPDGALEMRGFKTNLATREDLAFGCRLSPGSSLVVRREFFDRIGPFDDSLERLEDWDWLLRATDYSAIGLLQAPLCRIYAGARPTEEQIGRSIRQIKAKHDRSFKNVGTMASLKFHAGLLHERAVAAHGARRFVPAAAMLLLSIVLYPIRPFDLYPLIWSKALRKDVVVPGASELK